MSPTRRNVLTAVAATPFAITASLAVSAAGEDEAPAIAWQEALAAYRDATGAQDRADEAARAAEASLMETDPEHKRELQRLETAYDAVSAAQYSAFERLVDTPAPDLRALLEKVEIMTAEWTGEGLDGATLVEAEPIIDDLKRIMGVIA